MPRYEYTAVNAEGVHVSDVIDAESVNDAVGRLDAEGLSLRSIALVEEAAPERPRTNTPIADATQRVSALGDELLQPLRAYVSESPTGRRRRELQSIVDTLSSDDTNTAIDAAQADPVAWAPLLAAATADDDPNASVFARFVDREQPLTVLRRRRGLALSYPLFIAILTLLIAWPVAVFILPAFRQLYRDFGLELPAATELVLAIGCFIAGGGAYLFLALAVLLVVALKTARYWAPPWLTRWIQGFSSLGQGAALLSARLSRHTADLAEAGLPMSESFHLAAQRVQPGHVGRAINYAYSADASTASRVRLLRELSACYGDRAEARTSWAKGAAGPITVVFLGLLVGGFVIASLFLPLVRLIEGLT